MVSKRQTKMVISSRRGVGGWGEGEYIHDICLSQVLKSFTLTIQPGQTMALVGVWWLGGWGGGGSIFTVAVSVPGVEELHPDHPAWSDSGTGGGQWLRQVHHCQDDSETLRPPLRDGKCVSVEM